MWLAASQIVASAAVLVTVLPWREESVSGTLLYPRDERDSGHCGASTCTSCKVSALPRGDNFARGRGGLHSLLQVYQMKTVGNELSSQRRLAGFAQGLFPVLQSNLLDSRRQSGTVHPPGNLQPGPIWELRMNDLDQIKRLTLMLWHFPEKTLADAFASCGPIGGGGIVIHDLVKIAMSVPNHKLYCNLPARSFSWAQSIYSPVKSSEYLVCNTTVANFHHAG